MCGFELNVWGLVRGVYTNKQALSLSRGTVLSTRQQAFE